MQQDMHGKVNSRQDESLPTHQVLRDTLQDTIAVLQARRAVLGGALVDAALSPLLEQLAVLSSQPSPAGPVRRLRQVSVLFCDIVGSTQLSERLDPEDVQSVVDGALAAFTTIEQSDLAPIDIDRGQAGHGAREGAHALDQALDQVKREIPPRRQHALDFGMLHPRSPVHRGSRLASKLSSCSEAPGNRSLLNRSAPVGLGAATMPAPVGHRRSTRRTPCTPSASTPSELP